MDVVFYAEGKKGAVVHECVSLDAQGRTVQPRTVSLRTTMLSIFCDFLKGNPVTGKAYVDNIFAFYKAYAEDFKSRFAESTMRKNMYSINFIAKWLEANHPGVVPGDFHHRVEKAVGEFKNNFETTKGTLPLTFNLRAAVDYARLINKDGAGSLRYPANAALALFDIRHPEADFVRFSPRAQDVFDFKLDDYNFQNKEINFTHKKTGGIVTVSVGEHLDKYFVACRDAGCDYPFRSFSIQTVKSLNEQVGDLIVAALVAQGFSLPEPGDIQAASALTLTGVRTFNNNRAMDYIKSLADDSDGEGSTQGIKYQQLLSQYVGHSVEQNILYSRIPVASVWAKEVISKPQAQPLPTQDAPTQQVAVACNEDENGLPLGEVSQELFPSTEPADDEIIELDVACKKKERERKKKGKRLFGDREDEAISCFEPAVKQIRAATGCKKVSVTIHF